MSSTPLPLNSLAHYRHSSPLDFLNLSPRVLGVLGQIGITSVESLTFWTAESLLTVNGKPRRNFSQRSLLEIRQALLKEGLCLKGDERLVCPCMGCGTPASLHKMPLVPGLCPRCAEKLLKSPWVAGLLLIGLDKALEEGLFRRPQG